MEKQLQKATFGGGCFWCTEAIFKEVKGVISVTSGYSGGEKQNPTYEEVSLGTSGHVEAVQIEFDTRETNYLTLLKIFFKTHDPTSFDRQGADQGSQYRSVVFYHTEAQKEEVVKLIEKFNKDLVFGTKVVTEVRPFESFYKAEPYHVNFYERNKNHPYCQIVINPKLEKLYKEFADEVKSG